MTKRLHFSLFLLLFTTLSLEAQDPVFSQFFAAPIQLNPALTGSAFAPRISLNYRNQWAGLSNAYVTYTASYDQFFDHLSSGFGVTIMTDEAGDGIYKTNQLTGAYAYNFQLSPGFYLKGGLEAGLTQVRVDWSRLIFLDQIDPLRGHLDPTGTPYPSQEQQPFNLSAYYLDLSAGLVVYSENFYGGLSVRHVNAPDESIIETGGSTFGQVPVRFTLHGGAEISLRKGFKKKLKPAFISPNLMYVRQGEFQQINIGAYASSGAIFGGIWYRHTFENPDATIFLLGARYKTFKIGYSYDWTISELSNTGGTHEISFVYVVEQSRRRRAKNYLNCMKIFSF